MLLSPQLTPGKKREALVEMNIMIGLTVYYVVWVLLCVHVMQYEYHCLRTRTKSIETRKCSLLSWWRASNS